MKKIAFIFSMLVIITACEKEDPISFVKPKIFEKVWSSSFSELQLENNFSQNAYVYKDYYIIEGDLYSDKGPSLYGFDTKTGNLKWKWTHKGYLGTDLVGTENILIISGVKNIVAFDILTQSVIWEHIHSEPESVPILGNTGQLPIYENFVYKNLSIGSFYGPQIMVRYNIHTGIEERIFTFQLEPDQKTPNLSPPAFWVNPNTGDTLMIVVHSRERIDLTPENSPTNLVAYNLSKREIVWTLEEFTPRGSNQRYPPSVYKNTVLVAGDRSIYGVDVLTGIVKWRTQFPNLQWVGNFPFTKHLLIENRLYINPAGFDVMCIDAENGSILWHNKNAAPNCSPNMLYNDGMLIICSFGLGSVVIMDGMWGNIIHSERSKATYLSDVLYDNDTGMYFVKDHEQAVGFKINKPKLVNSLKNSK